jgi:HD-like signal output (HDOD) protein
MAQMTGTIDADEAYAAGLLHDIGRVVVLRAMNELTLRNKIDLGPQGPSLAVPVMDFLHVRMGARLLEMWGLPEVLALPALWHHTNDLPPRQPDMVRLVKAMDQLAIMAGFGSSDSATTNETEETLAEKYNFQSSDLNEVRELLQ